MRRKGSRIAEKIDREYKKELKMKNKVLNRKKFAPEINENAK